MSNNTLIFKRIVSLRNKYYDTQAQFVEKFNDYLYQKTQAEGTLGEEKNLQKITTNTYTTIENKLSTKSENLIAIVNFYSDIHDINPAWILSYDNFLISQYKIENQEIEKVQEYKKAIKEISQIITKIKKS